MRQARHIFLKDIRYLRYQIGLVVLLALALIWTSFRAPPRQIGGHTEPISILLIVAANFMIARLIHAEAIPGDRQFWVTRPYQWKSLMSAKLLFVLCFVHLPVLLAHVGILILNGFPLLSSIPGLLWTQLLIAAFVSLPVAALATVTNGLVQFVVAALTVIVMVAGAFYSMPFAQATLGPVDWVRNSIVFLALLVIATLAVYTQYRRRRTIFSRSFALVGLAIAGLVYLLTPWTFAFAVQSRLSRQPLDTTNMRITLDPSIRLLRGPTKLRLWEVVLPISLRGIPADVDFRADAVVVSLQGSGGRTSKWQIYEPGSDTQIDSGETTRLLRGTRTLTSKEYEVLRQGPLTAEISLFLTVFGKPQTKTIPLQERPVNVMDGLQCYGASVSRQGDVFCRTAFRWPSKLIDAKVSGGGASSFTQFISYSPFPANLGLHPIETRWASAYTSRMPLEAGEVTISVREPIAHVRRDFVVPGIDVRGFKGLK